MFSFFFQAAGGLGGFLRVIDGGLLISIRAEMVI